MREFFVIWRLVSSKLASVSREHGNDGHCKDSCDGPADSRININVRNVDILSRVGSKSFRSQNSWNT